MRCVWEELNLCFDDFKGWVTAKSFATLLEKPSLDKDLNSCDYLVLQQQQHALLAVALGLLLLE